MRQNKGLILITGVVWAVLLSMLHFSELLHSVLHIDILPESNTERWVLVIGMGTIITIIILWFKGYIVLEFNFDGKVRKQSRYKAIDDIYAADIAGQYEKVINMGANICRTLYIEGNHRLRYEIGKIIHDAAVKTKNRSIQIEAYIDYIGWSLVLMKSFDNSKAVEYITHGIDLAKTQPEDSFWTAKGIRHLGGIMLIERNYSQAESKFTEALTYANKINDEKHKKEMIAGIYFDMALIKLHLNDTQTAEQLCREGRKLREDVGDKTRICRMFALEGKIAEAKNDPISARTYFTEGLEYSLMLNRKDEIIRNHIGLARVLKDDDYSKAREHYEEAQRLLRDTDTPIDIYGKEEIPLL